MIFEAPVLAWLAPLVGIGFALGAWIARRRRVRLAAAWSAALGSAARATGRWSPVALGLAGVLGAVAVAGPRSGRAAVTTETQALNLVLAIDISRSMLAEDVAPNRLQRSVREARRLVQDLSGDRIGVVAFAGRSYILAPITVDAGAVRMYLDGLDPDLASEGGTALGSMLAQGLQLLTASSDVADRVLVVFTDGESHDTLPEAVGHARALREAGVQLVLVAQGGTAPARIPIRDVTGNLLEYKLDEDGQVVETRRRDDVLDAIADAADGIVIRSEVPDQAGAVRDLLTGMKRSPSRQTRTADLLPRAWIPVLAAAILLLWHTLTRRTAALIGIGGVLIAGPLSAQRSGAGERAIARGDAGAAAAAFLDEAKRGRAPDTAFYNAGTAALRAGRFDIARGALAEAAKSLDPELRYRALYNLGVGALVAAETDSAKAAEYLGEAVQRLQEALLLAPGSARAKWNLELAQRRQPPPPQGGGAGGGAPPPSGGGGRAEPEPTESEAGLSERQAEQILNSMERQERATRAEQQRRSRRAGAPAERDW